MSFSPQSRHWPADRAVLLVHGIGNASAGGDGAFPAEALAQVLGVDAERVAIYRLNYDFINDWEAQKVNFAAGIQVLRDALEAHSGDDRLAEVAADYAGDVLWPVLSSEIRFAVRDAMVAQLQQIHLDGAEAALSRGEDPLDCQISIIAHSLGCFHTYEVLSATVAEPSYRLRPASDLFELHAVMLMASPVQLIRAVCSEIRTFVPDIETLATLSRPLAIPSEVRGTRRVPCARHFVALTGTMDPVGGHLFGARQSWAFMDLEGQESVINRQQIVGIDSRLDLANLLQRARSGADVVNDPHSWTDYISRNGALIRGLLVDGTTGAHS